MPEPSSQIASNRRVRRWRSMPATGAVLASLALAGCAAVPKLGPAAAPLAAADVAASRSLPGTPGAQWPAEGWWTQYGDPQLDQLIAEGLANSPDIAASAARLRRAAAVAEQAGAARLPRVDLQGQAALVKNSLNLGYPEEFQRFLPRGWNDTGQVAANLGYELDLWGKNRATLRAATSEARAAALDTQQARLALAVAIASAYVDLDRLSAERDVRAREVETANRTRQLLSQRQANGLETRGGVANAETRQAQARLALNAVDEALAVRRNQLAALIGAGPDRGLDIARPKLAAAGPRALPADVTTDLLGRRPDVAAARERVEAAASRIKVARADFFPAVRLSALFGLQSVGLDLLFNKNSTFGSVGPALSLPIFHGGELQGRYRGARADYDAAVAAYNTTVVAGYQQVADALTGSRMVAQRLADARVARDAAQAAYTEIGLRYRGGLVTFLDVLAVEDRLLEAELTVAQLEQAARNADVALIRALGGGLTPAAAAELTKEPVHG